jgi:hypothetical protein
LSLGFHGRLHADLEPGNVVAEIVSRRTNGRGSSCGGLVVYYKNVNSRSPFLHGVGVLWYAKSTPSPEPQYCQREPKLAEL